MATLKLSFVVLLFFSDGICYEEKKLNCEVLIRKTGIVCIIFDLEVYTKTAKAVELVDNDLHDSFGGLYLMSPYMYYLPYNIFYFFPNITELKIISVVPQLLEIHSREFIGLERLTEVSISGQKIKLLGEKTFIGASNITNLFLPSNQIAKIHPNAFKGLVECLFLVLSKNRLTALANGTFDDMEKLWSVNLEDNKLLSMSENTFPAQHNLALFDFSFNMLKTIPQQPVRQLLSSRHDVVVFSLKQNECKYMRNTIFSKKSSIKDVKSLIKQCRHEIGQLKRGACGLSSKSLKKKKRNPEQRSSKKVLEEEDQLEAPAPAEEKNSVEDLKVENFPVETNAVAQIEDAKPQGPLLKLIAEEQKLLDDHNQVLTRVINQLEDFLDENGIEPKIGSADSREKTNLNQELELSEEDKSEQDSDGTSLEVDEGGIEEPSEETFNISIGKTEDEIDDPKGDHLESEEAFVDEPSDEAFNVSIDGPSGETEGAAKGELLQGESEETFNVSIINVSFEETKEVNDDKPRGETIDSEEAFVDEPSIEDFEPPSDEEYPAIDEPSGEVSLEKPLDGNDNDDHFEGAEKLDIDQPSIESDQVENAAAVNESIPTKNKKNKVIDPDDSSSEGLDKIVEELSEDEYSDEENESTRRKL